MLATDLAVGGSNPSRRAKCPGHTPHWGLTARLAEAMVNDLPDSRLRRGYTPLPAPRRAGCAVRSTHPADQAGGRVLVLLDMLWLGHDATPPAGGPLGEWCYEILVAYVRGHAPWTDRHSPGPINVDAMPRLRERGPGVQAAMLSLGRRAAPAGSPVGLMGTNLQRMRPSDTDIPGGANLEGVLFWRSSLVNASLGHANLREAKLGWTDLRHAVLNEVNLQGADLPE
jgi:hypothetical protein